MIEGGFTNDGDTLRDHYRFQTGVAKGSAGDGGDACRQLGGSQLGAVVESLLADGGYGVGNGNFCNGRATVESLIAELSELDIDPDKLKNCIIKTKSIDKSLDDFLSSYIVDIPKLADWQILAFVENNLPGVPKNEIRWLCDICKYDIYRISNEIDKIKLFTSGSQEIIFKLMNTENAFIDLNPLTIFNFTNAFIKKDKKAALEILKDIENIDIEPVGVVTLLYRNFKNIINIQLNPNATAASLNMNPKQFNAIKYNCGKYTSKELVEIFDLLTSIDMRLKNGDLPNNNIVDYLVVKILGLD